VGGTSIGPADDMSIDQGIWLERTNA